MTTGAASLRPTLIGSRHAVSTGHYLATLAAMRVLDAGGNAVDAETGHARVHVRNSVFASGKKSAKACYMFRGWFPGSLEYVAAAAGRKLKLTSAELQCAAEGHAHCVFETHSV